MINKIVGPKFDENRSSLRHIRSFVCRQGRLTKGQKQSLNTLWPIMGVEYRAKPVDFMKLFGCDAMVVLEIGFGMGASLVEMAIANPQKNFLGIEVHVPGIGACLRAAREASIENLRVICHDAIEVLQNMIPDNSLNMVQLFFPDPWHKTRHNKRRIVQIPFAELLLYKLQLGGKIHMATDWKDYAEQMLIVMNSVYGYKNQSETNDYIPRPSERPLTKFERRGQCLFHGVWDLIFERIK